MPREGLVEPLGVRLDLGQLGHGLLVLLDLPVLGPGAHGGEDAVEGPEDLLAVEQLLLVAA